MDRSFNDGNDGANGGTPNNSNDNLTCNADDGGSLATSLASPNLFSMNCQTHQKLDSIPESFFDGFRTHIFSTKYTLQLTVFPTRVGKTQKKANLRLEKCNFEL